MLRNKYVFLVFFLSLGCGANQSASHRDLVEIKKVHLKSDDLSSRAVEIDSFEAYVRDSEAAIELHDWNSLGFIGAPPVKRIGIDEDLSNQLRRLLGAGVRGGERLLIVVPYQKIIFDGSKIPEEIFSDLHQASSNLGFHSVRFLTYYHGRWFELYRQGLPNSDEVAQKRVEAMNAVKMLSDSNFVHNLWLDSNRK